MFSTWLSPGPNSCKAAGLQQWWPRFPCKTRLGYPLLLVTVDTCPWPPSFHHQRCFLQQPAVAFLPSDSTPLTSVFALQWGSLLFHTGCACRMEWTFLSNFPLLHGLSSLDHSCEPLASLISSMNCNGFEKCDCMFYSLCSVTSSFMLPWAHQSSLLLLPQSPDFRQAHTLPIVASISSLPSTPEPLDLCLKALIFKQDCPSENTFTGVSG